MCILAYNKLEAFENIWDLCFVKLFWKIANFAKQRNALRIGVAITHSVMISSDGIAEKYCHNSNVESGFFFHELNKQVPVLVVLTYT